MSSIYHQDNANYFILESQNTLSQLAEKVSDLSLETNESEMSMCREY